MQSTPDGFSTVTPFLVVNDSRKMLDFYKRAFNAIQKSCFESGGKVMHAEVQIGNSVIMMNDECEDSSCASPKRSGIRTSAIYLYVPNVDSLYQSALAAGAMSVSAPQNMFWGDRVATVEDPAGHYWHIATRQQDFSPEELQAHVSATKPELGHQRR